MLLVCLQHSRRSNFPDRPLILVRCVYRSVERRSCCLWVSLTSTDKNTFQTCLIKLDGEKKSWYWWLGIQIQIKPGSQLYGAWKTIPAKYLRSRFQIRHLTETWNHCNRLCHIFLNSVFRDGTKKWDVNQIRLCRLRCSTALQTHYKK